MQKQYHSYNEVIEALRQAPKGQARAEIIADENNRSLVLSSGANVTLFSGVLREGGSMRERFGNVYVGLLERLNARTGEREGVGGLGGLSERTDIGEFSRLDLEQRLELMPFKDDIALDEFNYPYITRDMDIIRKNNVLRETAEEMGNLGIYDFKPDAEKLRLVEMPGVKDDNYLVNIWNGGGNVWAITPFSHYMKADESLLDQLHQNSLKNTHEEHSEAKSYLKIPLFEALPRWGKHSGNKTSADSRDMAYDYRYPHEWLVSWKIASDMLNHNDSEMVRLMEEVQSSVAHRVSFQNAVMQMGQDLVWVAKVLGLQPGTVEKMENAAENIFLQKQNMLSAQLRNENAISGI